MFTCFIPSLFSMIPASIHAKLCTKMIILSLSLLVLTLALIWIKWGRSKCQIPGPPAIPLLGNVLQFIGDLPHKQLGKWAEKYGSIFQIRIGPKLNIVISDPTLLKKVFNDPNFTGRPFIDFIRIYEKDRLGILVNDGPFWETHRRFALRQLKDLGAFSRGMESSILDQVDKVIKIFRENQSHLSSSKIKHIMSHTTSASIWAVLCSGHDGSEGVILLEKTIKSINRLVKGGLLAIFCPWLRPICPNLIGYTEYKEALDRFGSFFKTVVKERKETFDETNIRDFIDVFLAETRKADPGTPFHGDVAEKQLAQSLLDMYGAAGDTTAGTIEWAIFYLCKNPIVQEKLQDEIARMTGNGRNVVLADKPKMHFALAVIEEVLRYSCLAPFGFFHRALQDANVDNYFIPKDTWIMSNLQYIHHNPKIWGDPENFRPERFIDSTGSFKRNENVMAFGTGRRQCVGESLARDTLFLYLTNIFQKFSIKFDPNQAEPGIEPKMSFLLEPYPFSVVIKDK